VRRLAVAPHVLQFGESLYPADVPAPTRRSLLNAAFALPAVPARTSQPVAQADVTVRSDSGGTDPAPVLMVRRGPIVMRSVEKLHADPRLELFTTDTLTPDWISFAQRVAGAFVATEGDPLSALGYAVTAGLRCPIVILMNRKYRADSHDLVTAGAAGCLMLPVDTPDLDRILPLLTTRAGSSRIDCTLRLLLDPISRTVRFHDQTVHLTQREFAVLHCLSSHNGRPVSAEDLLTFVWGETNPQDRSRQILEVYIHQLRQKLERLGLKAGVSTIRGFGYVLAHVSSEAGTTS